MKTIVLSIVSALLFGFTGFGQTFPAGPKQPLEKQVLQISAPLKNNLFTTVKEPLSENSRFTFDSLGMTYQGSWGFGQSFSISSAASGNIVFIGSGSGVFILDATAPQNPVTVAEISTRGLVDAIFYDEVTKRLFLTAYFAGFEIWDLNDMANPVRIGGGPTTGLPRGGIFANGNIVYVVTVADGLQVFDVTDPANPVNTGTCIIDPNNLCWNSAKSGNMIFAAVGEGGMVVIDVADPLDPHIAGTYAGLTSGVSVAGNYAYTVSWDNYFHVLDISNIASITETGNCFVNGYPVRTEVKGNYVYVANSTTNAGGGINVINVATPASPALVTTYAGYADHLTVTGDLVSFTGGSNPCTMLNISNPAAPVFASNYQIPVFTSDVHIDGNYLYTGNNGFRVFDISDPVHPVQVGYDTSDRAGAIVRTAGDKAVFIRESMGANNPIMIMDIADPAHPALLGQFMTPVMTSDLEIRDHYAFVGAWWDGCRVIDFLDPANPSQVAHIAGWFSGATPGVDFCYVQALDIEGNYLYLIDYGPFTTEDTRGLYIWDISNPENPVFVKRFTDFTSYPYDLDVSGNFVYIADNSGGMEVVDVTDKNAPVTRGYIFLPDGANAIKVTENHAFLADYIIGGVQAVDVTDPDNLVNDGYYMPSGCFALGVDVGGSNVYIADGAGGFQVYNTSLITGIPRHPGQAEISSKTYPDPFVDHVTIELTGIADQSLQIFDASGKMMTSLSPAGKNSGRIMYRWNGEHAGAGVYFYKTADGSVSGKLVKVQ